MTKYYFAGTYDVCEHNDLFQDMNDYPLDSSVDMEEQLKKLAKQDIAPLIRVYESDTSDFKDPKFYKEYKFKDYECGCNE